MDTYRFEELTGTVVTKDQHIYEESRQAWNHAIQKYPLVIVYCEEIVDIQNAIKWSLKYAVPFRIRSGTHHYEGYSTGNDLLVIDVSRMNKIYIDEDSQTVTIQGGARNREVYEAVCGLGYPFPGGGCPTVGVAGFTLGGGWGYSSRLLGLGCDNLIEVELIDYKGDLLVANTLKNEDLYWACRGGGGGMFGVITSLMFKLPEKMTMATLINIDYQCVGVEKVIEVAKAYQQFFKGLDLRLNLKMAMYNSQTKGKGVRLTGVFYGAKEEANRLLSQFKDATDYHLDYMTVLEVNRSIQDSHPEFEMYKSGGRFIYRDYDDEELRHMLQIIQDRANGSIYTAITFYGLGGKVSDLTPDATAFYYRDANFILGFQSVWEEPKYALVNQKWMQDGFDKLVHYTKGSFINFPFSIQEDYEERYYGGNLSKLKMIKQKYDPHNIFSFEQSIQL